MRKSKLWAPLKMHFSRDCSVGSTTAPGVVLPPAPMQSSVLTKLQEQILDSFMLARRAKYMEEFSQSSCIFHTLRFSALASCFALGFCSRRISISSFPGVVPPASMQSSARFPCTFVQDVLYAGFAGAKTGHRKSLFLEAPLC